MWGRRAALDLAAVEKVATPPDTIPEFRRLSSDLDEIISRRVADLTSYQSARYARRYAKLVQRVRDVEAERAPGQTALSKAVARYYYKLLAYKDEYEVARLYTETKFLERVNAMFEGDFKLVFHLAPPLWTKRDPVTGEPRKKAYGPGMLRTFGTLARLRKIRGSPIDVFRYSEDRKLDRRLIAEYEGLVQELIASLQASNYNLAVELASLPEAIRGYGHIRKRHVEHAKRREAELVEEFRGGADAQERAGPSCPMLSRGSSWRAVPKYRSAKRHRCHREARSDAAIRTVTTCQAPGSPRRRGAAR